MKHCYEFFNVYKAFRTFVKTQHFVVIKCFRYDLGGGGGWGGNMLLINSLSCASDGTIQQTSRRWSLTPMFQVFHLRELTGPFFLRLTHINFISLFMLKP